MKRTILTYVALLLLLTAGCVVLSSCGAGGNVTTLYVYNWGEYISDGSEESLDVNTAFEDYCREKLGREVVVNYSTYSSNEDMYSKISSGASAYDVIIPSDYMIERMISEDLLQPLDLTKIPNYQYIEDAFKGDNVYYECGSDKTYSVPYFYGMIGVIYNTDRVPETEESIGSWKLMWDEDYKGDILQYNNSRDAFGTALYYLGYDVNTATDAQWREALELLKAQKALVQGYVMDEVFNKMKSGSAAVASYYAGDFLTMYEDNDKLAFYYPKEGTNIYVDAMCIPKNAKNYDLALEYINFMCSEEPAVANAEYTYYASPNKLVVNSQEYQDCMAEVHEDAMDILYYSADGVKTSAYRNLEPEKLTMVNGLWEELKVESSTGNGIWILCGVIAAALIGAAVFVIVRNKRRQKNMY